MPQATEIIHAEVHSVRARRQCDVARAFTTSGTSGTASQHRPGHMHHRARRSRPAVAAGSLCSAVTAARARAVRPSTPSRSESVTATRRSDAGSNRAAGSISGAESERSSSASRRATRPNRVAQRLAARAEYRFERRHGIPFATRRLHRDRMLPRSRRELVVAVRDARRSTGTARSQD